ncbi:MAG: 4Fe-4S cluster-binding domain-containing protein [Clostridiales bacterium]|nr:4Fe-4S cluster-binding domain-containing protein [Clostridiales bacterium]
MICTLCPRRCGAERTAEAGGGFCRMPGGLRVARAMLHHWEEPPISGQNGAGTVFFSGCTLGCVYCQNGDISAGGFGKDISTARLREIFEELIAQGAHNIELVTPTHFLPWILPALTPRLPVPVVYNCGGYERVETLRALEGLVDVYLPDLKYADGALAAELSGAADYFPVACEAIREMFRQVGPYVLEDGLLTRGVVIRHLVLPGYLDNTRRVLDWIAETFAPGDVLVSLMSQYTPTANMTGRLARRITAAEYRAAADYMRNCGITDGFVQERTSAEEAYTPAFDGEGV